MPEKPPIRRRLPANREQRRSGYTAKPKAFGVYQIPTDESSKLIQNALDGIEAQVGAYLDRYVDPASPFVAVENLGVTYIQRMSVMRSKKLQQFAAGFKAGQSLQWLGGGTRADQGYTVNLARTTDDIDGELPFDWVSRHGRKLIARFALDETHDQLAQNADRLTDYLLEAEIEDIPVLAPDHITLFRYGSFRNSFPIGLTHRNAIADMVAEGLDDYHITGVELGRFVVGSAYDKPIDY